MKLATVRPRRTPYVDPFYHLFDEFFTPPNRMTGNSGLSTAALNVLEFDDYYELQLAIPGFTKENFHIEIIDDQLKVGLQTPEGKEEEKGTYRRKEFNYGPCDRSWDLNEDIDRETIKASYEKGILHIILRKKEEAKKLAPRSIEIS